MENINTVLYITLMVFPPCFYFAYQGHFSLCSCCRTFLIEAVDDLFRSRRDWFFPRPRHCYDPAYVEIRTKGLSHTKKYRADEDRADAHTQQNHMFYLALENNICHNYVTEKFWNSLRSLTVPVVFSRSVFEGMDVPSNAFIALDDFKSVIELVAHLKALQNDTEKYLK
uniref:Fucosyltransferase n=1 Tax=Meloidogyne incognita TaxID=6306 RepID=A0A914LGM7_MELIC